MSSENIASSMLQTTMMSANNPGLGTLCILPREIRDEIYRHLAKGHYWFKHNTGKITSRTKVPDLTLFSVSKATHDEISSLFYSESVFQFGHDQSSELATAHIELSAEPQQLMILTDAMSRYCLGSLLPQQVIESAVEVLWKARGQTGIGWRNMNVGIEHLSSL